MDERFTSLDDAWSIVALGEYLRSLEVSPDVLRADQRGSKPLSPRGPCEGGVLAYESLLSSMQVDAHNTHVINGFDSLSPRFFLRFRQAPLWIYESNPAALAIFRAVPRRNVAMLHPNLSPTLVPEPYRS